MIDIDFSAENPELYAVGVLICEQAHIVLEEFQKVSLFVQEQGNARLLDIEYGNTHSCILEPQETVLVHIELCILVQVFQNKTLVLGVEFGWDKVEYFVQVQLIVFVIPCDIPFVDIDDGSLFGSHVLHVLGLQVFPHS